MQDGENGYIFASGNVADLAGRMQQVADLTEEDRRLMGIASRRIIETWINRDLAQPLDKYIDLIYSH